MEICIIGTGANGSCIAADLTMAGYDVTLIDQWPDHVKVMQEHGLEIQLPHKKIRTFVNAYNLCDICTFGKKFDLIFLVVKGYDTRWTATIIEPYLKDDGIMIGLQNCMTAEIIKEIVGKKRNLGAVVELSSEIFEPGKIKRNTPPEGTWFGLGALSPEMVNRIPEVEEVLKFSGKVGISEQILSAKFMKLVVNVMGMGMKAIGDMMPSEAYAIEGMKDVMLRAGEEALKVGEGLGYKLEPIMGLSKEDIDSSNRVHELLLDTVSKHVGPTALNTVLQDHRKGRLSEVDLINGWVSEGGRKLGISTPVNDMIVEMTTKIHDGSLHPSQQLVIEIIQSLGKKN